MRVCMCSSFSTRNCSPGHDLIQQKTFVIHKHPHFHHEMELKSVSTGEGLPWDDGCIAYDNVPHGQI